MPIEQQVCSLELAKKLKELGVKQDSHFWWVNTASLKQEWEIMNTIDVDFSSRETRGISWREVGNPVSAFTVAELGDKIPGKYFNFIEKDDENRYRWNIGEYILFSDNEADARARMLIYLLENKLITL